MSLDSYTIDHSRLDWGTLLEEWRWLLPPQFKVCLLTRVGDLFIELRMVQSTGWRWEEASWSA